ncbi:MAG: 50S ribosomal protein L18, partial [Bacteroidota bacterium]
MKRTKEYNRKRIHQRIRKKVQGTPDRPRLAVYRSNKAIYCQLIDDMNGHTLASASSITIESGNKVEQANEVGKMLAEKAKAASIET